MSSSGWNSHWNGADNKGEIKRFRHSWRAEEIERIEELIATVLLRDRVPATSPTSVTRDKSAPVEGGKLDICNTWTRNKWQVAPKPLSEQSTATWICAALSFIIYQIYQPLRILLRLPTVDYSLMKRFNVTMKDWNVGLMQCSLLVQRLPHGRIRRPFRLIIHPHWHRHGMKLNKRS